MTRRGSVERAHSRWMDGSGPENDIVISSRIRLARNIEGVKFPHLLDDKGLEKILDDVESALKEHEAINVLGQLDFIKLDEISVNQRQILMEKHLISPALLEVGTHRAVAISEDETVSIMINEEDHLRIQCLFPGLHLGEAWELASRIDDLLEKSLNLAFCEEKGYLTACPSNVGTGLRASVMMHLPTLVITNQISRVINAVSQVGLTVRGLYGEGTEAIGNLFQLSNQVTLGQTEEDIISKLRLVALQVINQERSSREAMYRNNLEMLADRVWRAYGILRYAKAISSQEAMNLLSDLRLGADLALIPQVQPGILNEMMTLMGPSYLQKLAGKELSPSGRDLRRAQIINEKLKEFE